MFDFRLFNTEDGNQIIDRTLKTPYESLTPLQMLEYIEVDNQISRMERKQRREAQKQRKQARNPLWKLACVCGIV